MIEPVVAAIDVGKVSNVGWWRVFGDEAAGGRDLDELIDLVAMDLNQGRSVALGFEAPLFVPMPSATVSLGKQRRGESGRPWSASAGATVLATGVQQCGYVLNSLAAQLDRKIEVGFDVDLLGGEGGTLVVWEAFVSAGGKDRDVLDPHIDDARRAVEELCERLDGSTVRSDIGDTEVLNLVALSLLSSGLSSDVDLVRAPCLVIKTPDIAASSI